MTATHNDDQLMTVNWQLRLNTSAGSTSACSCAYIKCVSFAMIFTDSAEDCTCLLARTQNYQLGMEITVHRRITLVAASAEFVSYRIRNMSTQLQVINK